MHSKPAVMVKGFKRGDPQRAIKLKRGGPNKNKNSGPCGWKVRPSAMLHRLMREQARSYRASRKHRV